MTGADLANICNEAAIFAGREHRNELKTTDFQAALERVVAGMQSRRVITDHEKRVVAYHEAGHALCSELLASVEKVHRISIIPRGKALGYTLNLPEEDRYLKSKEELLDYMVVLLGGRVTEHLVFGTITTGRLGRPAQGPRHQPLDGDPVRHGHRADVEAGADGRLRDVGPHPPPGGRGAAVPDRPGAPARAEDGERATARCSTCWPTRCSRTRCSSARTSSGSWRSTATAAVAATRTATRRASCRCQSPARRRVAAAERLQDDPPS